MSDGESNADRAPGCVGRRDFLGRAAALSAAAWLAPWGLDPGRRLSFRRGDSGPRGEVSYPIPTTDGVTIDKSNQVILVRHDGMIYAFALSCPHQNTALRWQASEGRFQCPKHKSRYGPDGEFLSGRATRNMDRLPIRRAGATVVVNVDAVFESDHDPKAWADAEVHL